MIDDRKSGFALIAGSLGGIITMAIHPVAGGPLSLAQVDRLAFVSGCAHSLAMFSVLLLFLGACGLSRRLAASDRLSFSALVAYGFACVAIMIAAAVGGFIVPDIIRHMARDVPASMRQWQILIDGIFQINRAFARIYSVAASLAIILWSASVLRNGGLGPRLAIYGCVVSVLTVTGIAVGHLRLNVHGMAVVMLGEAIWFIAAAVQLLKRDIKPALAS